MNEAGQFICECEARWTSSVGYDTIVRNAERCANDAWTSQKKKERKRNEQVAQQNVDSQITDLADTTPGNEFKLYSISTDASRINERANENPPITQKGNKHSTYSTHSTNLASKGMNI